MSSSARVRAYTDRNDNYIDLYDNQIRLYILQYGFAVLISNKAFFTPALRELNPVTWEKNATVCFDIFKVQIAVSKSLFWSIKITCTLTLLNYLKKTQPKLKECEGIENINLSFYYVGLRQNVIMIVME